MPEEETEPTAEAPEEDLLHITPGLKIRQDVDLESKRPGYSAASAWAELGGDRGAFHAFVDTTPRLYVNTHAVRVGAKVALDFYCVDQGIAFASGDSGAIDYSNPAGVELEVDHGMLLPSASLMMDLENATALVMNLAKRLGLKVQ